MNWFHKNLSDREAASQMRTPVNEDEMLASVVLRGSECTKVNFIFYKTNIAFMRGLSEEWSWVGLKENPEILLGKDCQCNLQSWKRYFPK